MTRKNLFLIWITLVVFTITVVFASTFLVGKNHFPVIILLISSIKFIAIAYYFMELKKAHVFWKTILIIYLVLFLLSIYFLG